MHLALEAVDGGCRRRWFPWWRGRNGPVLRIGEASSELPHLLLEPVDCRGEHVEGGHRNGSRGRRIDMRRVELGECRAESDGDVLLAAAGGAEVVRMVVEAAVPEGSLAVGCSGIVEVSDTRLSGYVCRRA